MAYVHDASEVDPLLKERLAAEVARLKRLHPTWKRARLYRKAGERYNVNLVIEPSTKEKLTYGIAGQPGNDTPNQKGKDNGRGDHNPGNDKKHEPIGGGSPVGGEDGLGKGGDEDLVPGEHGQQD